MYAYFERFVIRLTRDQAESCSHTGQCYEDVREALRVPAIERQLRRIDPEAIRSELSGYGAWDTDELADDDANLERILWIAAGNILHPDG